MFAKGCIGPSGKSAGLGPRRGQEAGNQIPALSIPSCYDLVTSGLGSLSWESPSITQIIIVHVLNHAFIPQLFNEHLLCSRHRAFPGDSGTQKIHGTYLLGGANKTLDAKALCTR